MPNTTLVAVIRTSTSPLSHLRYASGYTFEDFRQAIEAALTLEEERWAREWLSDCQWNDADEEDIKDFDTFTIVKGLARNYDGGIVAFIAACY